MASGGARPDLVILSGGMWEERWTTYQRITERLRPHFRILYVEGNYSWGKIARGVARPGSFPLVPFGRLRALDDRFHVLTPPPRVFGRHFVRAVGNLNQAVLARAVRGAMSRLGIERPVLWSFLHQSDRVMGALGERLALYHCVDDWSWLMPRIPLLGSAARIRADEARTAARADLTVATSRHLRDRLVRHNPHSHHVPNAADLARFSAHALDDPQPPADVRHLPRPILGFSGTLEVKTDIPLLRRLALEHPEWTQVHIGHAENVPDLHLLRGLPNVHHLGLKAREEMPRYLRAFDVCLVPFRRTPELESISPLKIFEYLAAGRPVVATRYGEIEDLAGVVRLCEAPDDFDAAIARALDEDAPDDRRRRLAVAAENTWEARVETLLGLLDGALARRAGDALPSSSEDPRPT